MEIWLDEAGTDTILVECLVEYARGRGGKSIRDVCIRKHQRYRSMAKSQDKIRWRRFMEGMVSSEVLKLQSEFVVVQGMGMPMKRWSRGLITKLLEVMHGRWIYRNLLVHDRSSGVLAIWKKEELQKEIQRQQELGDEGLDEADNFLLEINWRT